MRAVAKFRPIPGIDGISVRAERMRWGFHIVYMGPSLESLADAGCITRDMLASFAVPLHGKCRADAEGDRYRRYPRKTKRFPEGVQVLRQITSSEVKALELPGVRELHHDDRRDRTVHENIGWGDLANADLAGGIVSRSRSVGRFQRIARWTVIGGLLIVPDWAGLARERPAGAP